MVQILGCRVQLQGQLAATPFGVGGAARQEDWTANKLGGSLWGYPGYPRTGMVVVCGESMFVWLVFKSLILLNFFLSNFGMRKFLSCDL